jgi:PAS domain S-box-containing protein
MLHKSEHLRKSVLIPVIFALLVLLFASVASLLAIQRLQILADVNEKLSEVEHFFPSFLEVESNLLSAQLDLIKEEKVLQDLWTAKDREQILQHTSPIFNAIKSKYGVTHFYFVNLDRTCFLRVHNPDRYGDFLKRTTLNNAKRKMQPASGIELGPLGTFTLRVVHPWFIDRNHVGYIELGKEINHITPVLKRSLGVDLIFTIRKELLERENWEQGRRMLNQNTDWNLLTDSIIIDTTVKEIPQEIANHLESSYGQKTDDVLKITLNDTKLRVKDLPLIDASARNVGKIIILVDVTDQISSLTTITLYVVSFYLILGIILFIFIFLLLGLTETKLTTYQQKLISEIDERKQAEQELKEHRNTLEETVKERTKELDDSLVKLKKEIKDRKLAEEALRLSEAQFRGVFEGSALGITISDLDGYIILSNPAYQKMLGYNHEELQQKNFSDLTYDADVQKQKELYEELLAGKRDFFQAEKRYKNKDGTIVWGQLTVSLVRDQNQKPLFVIGLVENIDQKKALENERLKAGKLESIGILAGGIAHDFNNLLTAIVGNISLAKKHLGPDNSAAKRLDEAEKAVIRTRDLTQQLLTFSKGGEPVKRALPITDIVRDSAVFALRGSNAKCTFDIPADLWHTKVDGGQFSQVIQNLVINGAHAMPDGGVINITACNITVEAANNMALPKGIYVKLSVADHGCGIDNDRIQKIYDPYFTTKEEGSGLGLAIVHSIIKNHDGLVQVESELGRGTTFNIYLPAIVNKKYSQQVTNEKIVPGSGKILLMDDEEMILDFASELLKELGYTVTLAREGKEAIALYKDALKTDTPFKAVLMDITIPGGMGGKEAVLEILALDKHANVIVSSGYAKDPIMSNYKQYGFVGVIPKPYNVRELSQELHRVLTKKKLTIQN